MKRFALLLLAVLLLISSAACSGLPGLQLPSGGELPFGSQFHSGGQLFPNATDNASGGLPFDGLLHTQDPDAFSFTTKDVNGNTVNSRDIFGSNKITMVNVWASWCGPCVGELSELERISAELKDMGCELIGILDDGDTTSGLAAGKELISAYGLTYTVLVSNSSIRSQLDMQYYPTTFFVDGSGRLIGDPVIGAQVDMYLPTVRSLLASLGG